MKLLIACSGSGGHFFPALALADELAKRKDTEISFLETQKKNINSLITEKGFTLVQFNLDNVSFNSFSRAFVSVFKLLFAAVSSLIVIFRVKPDVVAGFGGYHSGPIVLAARMFGIPAIIHEQNVLPGKANHILAKFVNKVAISFEESKQFFNDKKVVLTGCPLRKEVVDISVEEAYAKYSFSKNKLTIFVMGGSQGSHNINTKFIEAISQVENKDKLQIIHITGAEDYESISKEYSNLKIDSLVFAFLKEIGYAYKSADIIITRAGASTICEIIALRIPAVIIPYPYAKKHQTANARLISDRGAAILLEDEKLASNELKEIISSFMMDKNRISQMKNGFGDLRTLNAVDNLAREVLSLKRC